jgi:hypothetical protein
MLVLSHNYQRSARFQIGDDEVKVSFFDQTGRSAASGKADT